MEKKDDVFQNLNEEEKKAQQNVKIKTNVEDNEEKKPQSNVKEKGNVEDSQNLKVEKEMNEQIMENPK